MEKERSHAYLVRQVKELQRQLNQAEDVEYALGMCSNSLTSLYCDLFCIIRVVVCVGTWRAVCPRLRLCCGAAWRALVPTLARTHSSLSAPKRSPSFEELKARKWKTDDTWPKEERVVMLSSIGTHLHTLTPMLLSSLCHPFFLSSCCIRTLTSRAPNDNLQPVRTT